jgi:hypothetical protein
MVLQEQEHKDNTDEDNNNKDFNDTAQLWWRNS